ncbi:hypothetical protein EC991_007572 [Linnemannia zychae]|nr:hypothetical protein EC991_007572 [Linnemannia zychae]
MSSQQTAAIPAIRHHRRSVDRVLPPALEVRLARLSIDEGESKSAHIVPAPPSLPLRMSMSDFDREYNHAGSQDSFSSSVSSNNNSSGLESIVEGASSTYTNNNRLGSLGTSPDKGSGHPRRHHHHHHHRSRSLSSSSMLNPQAPSALLQIDQQHQQNYHQPNIMVQYHRRNRSGSQLLGDSRGNNRTQDTGGSPFFSSPSFTQKQQQKEQSGIGAAAAIYSDSPMMMDTTEFGEDLFHWSSLELDNGFADSPTIARPHPQRQAGIYMCDGSMNESDSSLQECASTYHTPPTMHSPSRKGPLSAASSLSSSRSSSPLSGRRTPLGELTENAVRVRDQSFGSVHDKARGLRIDTLDDSDGSSGDSGNYLDIPKMDEDRLPPGSPMSIGVMSNEQDRWKSPTLSALASRSSSWGPSPRALSPSPLSQRSAIVMAMPSRHSNLDRENFSESVAIDDMKVEIPLIETRDEVPLQDIWKMEDEERKDRLNGAGSEKADDGTIEEHIANMKGEQHAREEARLIQEAIVVHSHKAL